MYWWIPVQLYCQHAKRDATRETNNVKPVIHGGMPTDRSIRWTPGNYEKCCIFFKGRDEAKIVGGKAECKVKIKLIVQFGAWLKRLPVFPLLIRPKSACHSGEKQRGKFWQGVGCVVSLGVCGSLGVDGEWFDDTCENDDQKGVWVSKSGLLETFMWIATRHGSEALHLPDDVWWENAWIPAEAISFRRFIYKSNIFLPKTTFCCNTLLQLSSIFHIRSCSNNFSHILVVPAALLLLQWPVAGMLRWRSEGEVWNGGSSALEDIFN